MMIAFATGGALMVFWWPRPITVTKFRVLGGLFVAFGLLGALASGALDLVTRLSLSDDLQSGRAQVVEGPITDFAAMPSSCHGTESFNVSQKHFAYADGEATGGFNHTSTCGGGPFRLGERVRLDYVSKGNANVIVRGDVAE